MHKRLITILFLWWYGAVLECAAAEHTGVDLSEANLIHECGTPTFCVTLLAPGFEQHSVVIDELNREKDTILAVEMRIPQWFGPHPAKFVYESQVLSRDRNLASYGIRPGGIIEMRKKGKSEL